MTQRMANGILKFLFVVLVGASIHYHWWAGAVTLTMLWYTIIETERP